MLKTPSVHILLILFILFFGHQGFTQEKNIALNKPITATSEQPENPASNAVDGEISRDSKWMAATGSAPHILEVDLRKYYKINEIRLHSGILEEEKLPNEKTQAAGFWSVKNFKFQYWDDANWNDFPKTEVKENRLTTAVFKFDPTITTFKIRMVSDDGEPINVMELEVFGTEAPNMPSPPYFTSNIQKQTVSTENQTATITVKADTIGNSMKYVGYNQGYYFPGSNVSGWLEYSNVNSLRVWTNLNTYVPVSAVNLGPEVENVEEFDKRKTALRKNPESNEFIQWEILKDIYSSADSSGVNAMVLDYTLEELKRLNIDPLLQISSTDFSDNWSHKWQQWLRYYALAYYAAKNGDISMYAMQNEPNHAHSGPMELDQYVMGMQIVSDAVKSAVNDVNEKYNKTLEAKFVGPVTAGQNTDWWAGVVKAIRTDFRGNTVNEDLIDIFSTHSYNSPATGYSSRVLNIRDVIVENHPEGKKLPIVFTEIGRWMNAYLIDKKETMDSPSLFTEWAGIYSNNMKNGGYGMWAFKFSNTTSNAYPGGIKSGHHYTWQGKRVVEDAIENLALNKPVSSSSRNSKKDVFVTDGDKSDESFWVSDSNSREKWIEIDLEGIKEIGGVAVHTGSSYGDYTGPDRIKNFKMQYLADDDTWKDIPETKKENFRYVQFFEKLPEPVKTNKVRYVILDEGISKVREIKLFHPGEGLSGTPSYNISGIQRTGEVVRLFAKGFKEERPLLKTTSSVDDPGLDTYTSFDAKSGNYYMWLVQRGHFDYDLTIDLSKLSIAPEVPITAEKADKASYGEVTNLMSLSEDKIFNFNLPAQSVVLLSIPSGPLEENKIFPVADAMVSAGSKSEKNDGRSQILKVSMNAETPEENNVVYMHFEGLKKQASNAEKIILAVNGKTDGDSIYRLHVYGIPSQGFKEDQIKWNDALQLDANEALIHGVGQEAFVAGELAFDKEWQYHYLDVTQQVKKYGEMGISFVFVREARHFGDDEDKGEQVLLHSKEADEKPFLKIWLPKSN
jgi:hypothetical protein